jgi:hypothetical protein
MFQSPQALIKLKIHSRHLYLGWAAFALHRGDIDDVHTNLMVVERMQEDIEKLEREINKTDTAYDVV